MNTIIDCPDCGARYRIDTSRFKKTVARIKCPQCTAVFEVDIAHSTPPVQGSGAVSHPPAGEVLIVDDSKFFRELVSDVLKPLQLQIAMAGDGAEALQIIRRQPPSLVILDLNLPGMSGYDLIREIRQDSSLNNVRLLAMSGVYRSETDAAEVQAAGADDFVSKSFKPEQMQFRVKRLLSGET